MPSHNHGLWINGASRPGTSGLTAVVRNPYDDAPVSEVVLASESDVRDAIAAAAECCRTTMAEMARHERIDALRQVAARLRDEAETMVRIIVSEGGKPIRDAEREVGRAARLFEMAAEQLATMDVGSVLPMDIVASGVNRFGYTTRVPVGVIAAIVPSNSPINLAANKIAPALAMGNTVVLKPADQTPISSLLLGRIVSESGFPPGALNVVMGSVDEVGKPLVTDDRVRLVSVTGGLETGKQIAASAGLKRLILELGSSAANVVFADADVKRAARSLATSAYLSSGQACISAQRLIVHEDVADEFVEAFIAAADAMVIGDPMDPVTEIGPMISTGSRDRVLGWIEEATEAGARVLTGGQPHDRTIRPALLVDVPDTVSLGCEEAFGPVATLARFTTVDEAIDLVNSSQYGLQAGVFTDDLGTAFRCAQQFDVGALWINDSSRYRQDNYPFGGRKNSGLGREGVRYAMEEMSDLRFVGLRLGLSGGILG